MVTKKQIEQWKDQARAVLLDHPMYEAIAERIEPWLERVSKVDPKRLVWHARRTLGFGGSEIGVLVKNSRGEKGNFGSSATEIVKGKLLMSAPFASRGPLRRGSDLEPLIQADFQRLSSSKSIEEGISLLSDSKSERGRLRYSPDDLVVINFYEYEEKRARFTNKGYGHLLPELANDSFKEELLALVDYKCPTEVKREASGKPMADFEYVCQLTGGTGLLMEQGFAPDVNLLVQWDMAAWEPVPLVVEYQPALYAEIIDVCEHYWDTYVMKDSVPDPVTKTVHLGYPDKPDLAKALDIYSVEFAKSSVANKFFEDRSKMLQNSIKSILSMAPPDTVGTMVLDKLKVGVKAGVDESALFKDLIREGCKVDTLVSPSTEYDPHLLLAYVSEKEEDMTPFLATVPDLEKMKRAASEVKIPLERYKKVETRFTADKKSITLNEKQMLGLLHPEELPDLSPLLGMKPDLKAIGDGYDEMEESQESSPLRI